MNRYFFLRFCGVLSALGVLLALSCSPPVERPTGAARDYYEAKDAFKRGRWDRALEYSDGQAKSSPPTAYTERSRVLQTVVLSGQIKGYKELVDAFQKGAEVTKNPRYRVQYNRMRNDYLQYGSRVALHLAEVSNQITEGGSVPKELTLEAPYPNTEGPAVVVPLTQVMQGAWIEPEVQESAVHDVLLKGVDDALAEAVGGDRSKARTDLTAGPVKLAGGDFALFLTKQLAVGATFFDLKHIRDPQKLKILCAEADDAAKAALAPLKESPDKEREKEVKKLQEKIKTTSKYI